jgi:sulfide dehydrogenase [flavocytochrome c] flavoprotein subunit
LTRLITRREFNRGLSTAAGLSAIAIPSVSRAQGAGRVVVIGGGFGGATAAKYVKLADPSLDVQLVESSREYVTCPYSNLVIAGMCDIGSITRRYDTLSTKHGIGLVHDRAVGVDPVSRTVQLQGGQTLRYDRLIASPGIEIRFDALEGYGEAEAEIMPHAWLAGPQTLLLRHQLEAMADGGLVVITVPANPIRCPPGPYERASLIAHYLKVNKPRSKIIILDAKDTFSKQPLFLEAWRQLYPGMIEWIGLSRDGKVVRADAREMTVHTDFGSSYKGAVVNVIPPHRAARIARDAGLTNETGWCPLNPRTMESAKVPNIHVIGDACIAGTMPKSGFAANSQAKVAAAAAVALLKGSPVEEPSWLNTCYSYVAGDYAISIAGVYKVKPDDTIGDVEGAGGTSPVGAEPAIRKLEASYAEGWYDSITADTFS